MNTEGHVNPFLLLQQLAPISIEKQQRHKAPAPIYRQVQLLIHLLIEKIEESYPQTKSEIMKSDTRPISFFFLSRES